MKESDIRPEAMLDRYLALSEADADRCFSESLRCDVPCVGCGGTSQSPEFTKNGFGYVSCKDCGSLFQSPRPGLKAFEGFYRDSESSRYWAEEFFPAVAEARRKRIFSPRAERLAAMCDARELHIERLIDVGAGFGILLEEWRRIKPDTELLAIEPSATLAMECRAKGLEVLEEMAEHVIGYRDHADLVVCFEVLEHAYDPLQFIRTLSGFARPGGYVFISTLGVDGFDIQVLWENSKSIFPPHHINFLSVEGFQRLFERAGLEAVEVTTPGVLDVDIVRNAIRRSPQLLRDQRFVSRILSSDHVATEFQDFLARNQLSSHTWVLGRKPLNAAMYGQA
jgi:SAM-dependent methyltransferase